MPPRICFLAACVTHALSHTIQESIQFYDFTMEPIGDGGAYKYKCKTGTWCGVGFGSLTMKNSDMVICSETECTHRLSTGHASPKYVSTVPANITVFGSTFTAEWDSPVEMSNHIIWGSGMVLPNYPFLPHYAKGSMVYSPSSLSPPLPTPVYIARFSPSFELKWERGIGVDTATTQFILTCDEGFWCGFGLGTSMEAAETVLCDVDKCTVGSSNGYNRPTPHPNRPLENLKIELGNGTRRYSWTSSTPTTESVIWAVGLSGIDGHVQRGLATVRFSDGSFEVRLLNTNIEFGRLWVPWGIIAAFSLTAFTPSVKARKNFFFDIILITAMLVLSYLSTKGTGRGTGSVASVLLGFILLTSPKRLTPFNKSIELHKYTGTSIVFWMGLHAVTRMVKYPAENLLSMGDLQGVAPLAGFVSAGSCVLLCLTSIRPIRKRCYNLFLYPHWVLSAVIIGFGCWHSYILTAFCTPGVLLRFIEEVQNDSKGWCVIVKKRTVPGYCKLTIRTFGAQWGSNKPGSYVILRFPRDGLQGHPFSVTQCDGKVINVVLKSKGQHTSTGTIIQSVPSHIRVSGLIASPEAEAFSEVDTMLLAACGIGITPLFSFITNPSSRYDLHWSVRDPAIFELLYPDIVCLLNSMPLLGITIHVTGGASVAVPVGVGRLTSVVGRMVPVDLYDSWFSNLLEEHGRLGVCLSGPAGFTSPFKRIVRCSTSTILYHEEPFMF
eukprot:TRINITY_DN2669_c3_g2_i1.p1 TRINITY_DN2669_c3_g2~~TRINITY_DN2669_c3_g2_i1.p1  ORF type:complete len:740 (+),score=42.54 TRINITY_DN2669_c3_g2_i1:60-2222(+)